MKWGIVWGIIIMSAAAPPVRGAGDDAGFPLQPVGGGDGAFETVTRDGLTAWRGRDDGRGAFCPFLYFRVPDSAREAAGPVYVEVRYKDLGQGRLGLEYNARPPGGDYRRAERGYGVLLSGGEAYRTAVFELARPEFRRAQNSGADLRLCGPGGKAPLHVVSATLFRASTPLFRERSSRPWLRPYDGPTRSDVDATTLRGKVLCGYQGWFRCPGDETEQGWVHWSRDRSRIAPATLTFDMWPDLSEFPPAEKHPAPGFAHRDDSPAYLFSSADAGTVGRHFEWMRTYGIDGVLVQRFVVDVRDPAEASRVLCHARDAAHRTGRVFAVDYDLSGTPRGEMFDRLVADWKWLVDELKITADPRYLRHGGKPVVAIFGFYDDRMEAALAHRIIDFFKNDPKYGVTLVGGCPWYWRKAKDPEWARAYRRFDVLKPWNVGNVSVRGGVRHAATTEWEADLAEAKRSGVLWMPVLYPGFSWDNLQRQPPGRTTIPRRGGEFFREQFVEAARLGVETAFVAMFDEVDEGTAVFKVTNSPPQPGHFVTLEGLPSDTYLRLTGEGTRLLRGEGKAAGATPGGPPR